MLCAMDNFEEWFTSQDFYTNLHFIHGDALFFKDGDVYRVLTVRIASEAWQEQQKEIRWLNNKADDLALDQMKTAQFNYQLEQKVAELKAKVDAVNKLIQGYKDEERELELKEWEQSTIYGRVAIELEQALKGGE